MWAARPRRRGRSHRAEHVSSTVFTDPEIATVGLTQRDLDEGSFRGDSVLVPLAGNARAKMQEQGDGFVELLCRRGSRIVAGAVVVSQHARRRVRPPVDDRRRAAPDRRAGRHLHHLSEPVRLDRGGGQAPAHRRRVARRRGCARRYCRRVSEHPSTALATRRAQEAAQALADRTQVPAHDVAVVLGSAEYRRRPDRHDPGRPARDRPPHFAPPAVEGHAGRVRSVDADGTNVLVFLGRTHLYRGESGWRRGSAPPCAPRQPRAAVPSS